MGTLTRVVSAASLAFAAVLAPASAEPTTLTAATAAAGGANGAATAATAAQGRLERATFRATIPADSGHAAVHITYVVAAARSARDSVPLTLLRFDGAAVRNVITRVNSIAVDPALRAGESALRLHGLVPLHADVSGALVDPEPPGVVDSSFVIDITYDVAITSRDPAYPLRLPILAVMWPPDAALPGTFQGEIAVPSGLRIYDPFPAGLRPVAANASAPTADVLRYAVDLPVLPAMIAFHLAPVDQPVVTLANVLDVFVLLAIAVIWTFMWRQFRREA